MNDVEHDRAPGRAAPSLSLSAGLTVNGDLDAVEDLRIDGRFKGRITLLDHHLTVGAGAAVDARIVAKAVTIHGQVTGTIVAERVALLPGAAVQGHVTTPCVLMADGAGFTGTIDPRRNEAATQVARYRQRQGAPVDDERSE